MFALEGESPRGREAGQWRGGFGQRTLSWTRERERMSALGGEESMREGGWSIARGIWSTDFVADASRGREGMSASTSSAQGFGRESPREREAGQ